MTLTYHRDNSELMQNCVFWFTGYNQTVLGFPILPAGVTVTPNGTFTTTNLGNNKRVIDFNGTNSRIRLTDHTIWNWWNNGKFTITGWYKINDTDVTSMIFRQVTSDGRNNNYISGTPSRFLVRSKTDNAGSTDYQCSYSLSLDTWVHFAFTYNNTTFVSYINGTIYPTSIRIAYTGTTINVSEPMYIGYDPYNNEYYDINLKDLLIYQGRALTQSEIIEIMRLTNPASGRDFAAIYPGSRGVE